MVFSTVYQALGAWYRKPLSKLPRDLRPFAEAYIPKWDDITSSQREEKAKEVDRQRNLKTRIKLDRAYRQNKQDEANAGPMEIEAGSHIGYYKEQHVQTWLTMDAVSPQEAALLFFGENPFKYKDQLPYIGDDFDTMKRTFEDAARDGLARNLRDWLSVARARNLHGMAMDGWEACIDLSARDAQTQTDTQPQAAHAKVKRWTPEFLAEVAAYREAHGTKATALHFGISGAHIRRKLPGQRTAQGGHSVFTHRIK